MAAGGVGAVFAATPAMAQWVSFADETATRLQVSTVGINDAEEKDTSIGDFNNDGWMDVIAVRKRPFSVMGPRSDVLFMNEQGTLVDRTTELAPEFLTVLTDARDVFVGDMDNDGWDDLIIVSTFNVQPQYYENLGNDSNGQWRGFENQSANRFPNVTVFPLQFCAGWAGDVDGNGWKDFYFVNYNPNGMVKDVLFMNTGNGFFVDETQARMGDLRNSAFGTGVELRDIDNDGDVDIVKTSTLFGVPPWNTNGIFPLFNDGTGNFNWTGMTLGGGNPYMFTVVDFNGDGKRDIYAEKDSQDVVYTAGAITPDVNIAYSQNSVNSSRTTGFGGNTKAADVDGDGDLDVGVGPIDVDIANCGGSGKFSLMRNSNGTLTDPFGANTNINIQPHDFDFVDVDNDGCLDIFMGLCTGWRVFIQTSPGCGVQAPPADLNGDGVVNGADLAILLIGWGGNGAGDLNNDGIINGADLATLLTNWG